MYDNHEKDSSSKEEYYLYNFFQAYSVAKYFF